MNTFAQILHLMSNFSKHVYSNLVAHISLFFSFAQSIFFSIAQFVPKIAQMVQRNTFFQNFLQNLLLILKSSFKNLFPEFNFFCHLPTFFLPQNSKFPEIQFFFYFSNAFYEQYGLYDLIQNRSFKVLSESINQTQVAYFVFPTTHHFASILV